MSAMGCSCGTTSVGGGSIAAPPRQRHVFNRRLDLPLNPFLVYFPPFRQNRVRKHAIAMASCDGSLDGVRGAAAARAGCRADAVPAPRGTRRPAGPDRRAPRARSRRGPVLRGSKPGSPVAQGRGEPGRGGQASAAATHRGARRAGQWARPCRRRRSGDRPGPAGRRQNHLGRVGAICADAEGTGRGGQLRRSGAETGGSDRTGRACRSRQFPFAG